MDEASSSSSSNAKLSTNNYRIQVSRTKKPLNFYINLVKKHISRYNKVELHALGMAIPSAIMISENVKESGLATQKLISTSTVKKKNEVSGKFIQKAKIEIILASREQFDQPKANEIITETTAQPKLRPGKATKKITKETSYDINANCQSQDETIDAEDNVKFVDEVVCFDSLSLSSHDENVDGKSSVKIANAEKAEKSRLRNLQKELNRKLRNLLALSNTDLIISLTLIAYKCNEVITWINLALVQYFILN